jgi:hypothetical protein
MSAKVMDMDKGTVRGYESLIREMQRTTGADMEIVVRNVARDYTRASMRSTKIADDKVTEFEVITRRDGSTVLLPTGKTVTPKGRGFAKAGWLAVLAKLGVRLNSNFPVGTGANDASDVKKNQGGGKAIVSLANQVPYIVKLDRGDEFNKPGNIQTKAERITLRKMERHLSNQAKKMRKGWQ